MTPGHPALLRLLDCTSIHMLCKLYDVVLRDALIYASTLPYLPCVELINGPRFPPLRMCPRYVCIIHEVAGHASHPACRPASHGRPPTTAKLTRPSFSSSFSDQLLPCSLYFLRHSTYDIRMSGPEINRPGRMSWLSIVSLPLTMTAAPWPLAGGLIHLFRLAGLE